MRKFTYLWIFFMPLFVSSEVFLECSPYKTQKNEPTKDLLFVMTNKENSRILEKELEEGVYWFNRADGKIYDKTNRINSTHISYTSYIFNISGIYKTKKRVLVDRKTLKAKMIWKDNISNRTKTSKKDFGECKILSEEEYRKQVEEIIATKEQGNQF